MQRENRIVRNKPYRHVNVVSYIIYLFYLLIISVAQMILIANFYFYFQTKYYSCKKSAFLLNL